jgi:PAS domain S-box-containing protein
VIHRLAAEEEYRQGGSSPARRRRLGEGRDGILILDPESTIIVNADPFLTEILGFSRDELLGRPLGETGLLGWEPAGTTLVEQVRRNGYGRRDALPVRTRDGRRILVDVVGNSYREDDRTVVQLNVGSLRESHSDVGPR